MSKEAFPLPVDSVPQEAVRFSDVISHVEIATEEPPIVNFRDSNIKVLYEDLGMTAKSVGKAIGMSKGYTNKLLHKQGVEMRSPHTPEYTFRRLEGTRRVFSDPARKAEIVARIHAPGSDNKRSKSYKKRLETDPTLLATHLSNLQIARDVFSKRVAERRAERERISSEQVRLAREEEIQFVQSLLDNPAFSSLTLQQRRVIELRYRTDGSPRPSFRQVGELMGGITRQAVHDCESAALDKLGLKNKKKKNASQN